MFNLSKVSGYLLKSLVIITVSIFSCQKNKNLISDEDFASYHLEKEKEFLVNSLSTVELLDYFPEDKLYLGYTITHSGKEICLVNEKGEIIISRNMQGEGPNQYSSNLSCLSFSEQGDIWAMTSVQILRYDQNLNLLERFSYKPNHMITFYALSKKFSYYRKDTNKTEIIFPVNPSGIGRNNIRSREQYFNSKLMELYDQKQGSSKEIALISERNVTEEFLRIVGGFYAPVYVIDVNTNKLYLTSTFDNQLAIYDLNADTLTGRLDLYYGDLNALEPSTEISAQTLNTNPEGWLLSPKNHNIHKFDNGLFGLEYIMDVSINPHPNQGNQESEIFEDIFQNRLILFDQDSQLSNDLVVPEQGAIMTSLPGNRLLIKSIDPDREDDFTRYSIYEIIKE